MFSRVTQTAVRTNSINLSSAPPALTKPPVSQKGTHSSSSKALKTN